MATEQRATKYSLHARGSHKQGKWLLPLWTLCFTGGKESCLKRSLLHTVGKAGAPRGGDFEGRVEGCEGGSYANL